MVAHNTIYTYVAKDFMALYTRNKLKPTMALDKEILICKMMVFVLFIYKNTEASPCGFGTYHIMPGKFQMLLCRLLIFFHNQLLGKFDQEYHQSVKQFGSRAGPTFCRALSGSKLLAMVVSRRQASTGLRRYLVHERPKIWSSHCEQRML